MSFASSFAYLGARLRVSVLAAVALAATCLVSGMAHGSVGVSAGGTASYAYPVSVPPGIAGMSPNLSISYAGGGVNGPVGLGWSVQGISTITRCPSSKLIDGSLRTVEFDAADKLCLDGQRLVQTDANGAVSPTQIDDAKGLAGTAFREYRTEKDSFARVRAYGTWGGNLANGPLYFKVWTKSGQVYDYGHSPGGTVNAVVQATGFTATTPVAVWAVSRVSDVVGNYMAFEYLQRDAMAGTGTTATPTPGKEWRIEEIRYTGNGAQAPSNKVVFAYTDRLSDGTSLLDRSEAYQLKNKNVSLWRLEAIRTYVNWPAAGVSSPPSTAVKVRTVKLAYSKGTVSGRSRVSSISECAGPGESPCLPGPRFNYADGGAPTFAAHSVFGSSSLRTLKMQDTAGNYGILTGDFNGDGLTDFLRWGNNPAENELHFSRGDGGFDKSANSGLLSINFFSANGCFSSMAADFNGDGLTDIPRIAKPNCTPNTNVLYLAAAGGGFTSMPLLSGIDLQNLKATKSFTSAVCQQPQRAVDVEAGSSGGTNPLSGSFVKPPQEVIRPESVATTGTSPTLNGPVVTSFNSCFQHSRTTGKRFYVLDLNGDGLMDILTTVAPSYNWNSGWGAVPNEQELCLGSGVPAFTGYCSRVFQGSVTGAFTEVTATSNIRNSSLYSDVSPKTDPKANPFWRRPDQVDINGDGLQDILGTFSGNWRSTGDFGFITSGVQDSSQLCGMPIDINGDGRADCLLPDAVASNQRLALSYGALISQTIQSFNLKTAPDNLYALDTSNRQTVGMLVEDFDGDGRQDILRWGPTASDNGIYLSNGDGSFRPRIAAGLNNISRPLQSADGSTSFVAGDFLGLGTLQFLHLKANPSATGDVVANTNQLYVRPDTPAPDRLESVRSPSGLVTTLTYARLTGDAPGTPNAQRRYLSDREAGTPSTYPLVDLRPPMPVIVKSETQTASAAGGTVAVEYAYRGLRAALDGRGMLGFRQSVQQSPAPNGQPLSVWTSYLPQVPYLGVAHLTETRRGAWTAPASPLLSQTVSVYCDKTSATLPTAATETQPCATTAKVTRPFLYKTVETGVDLDGTALPTVETINSYNNHGDPLTISVKSTGVVAGASREFTRLTTNEFCGPNGNTSTGALCPNKVNDTEWILGRLVRSTVTNTVPDLRSALTASAGSAPFATALTGSPPPTTPPTPLSPAQLAVILQLLLGD